MRNGFSVFGVRCSAIAAVLQFARRCAGVALLGNFLICNSLSAAPPCGAHVCHDTYRGYSHDDCHHDYHDVILRIVNEPYFYSVGAELREEAVAERIAAKVQKKLAAAAPKTAAEHVALGGEKQLKKSCIGCHKEGTRAVLEQDAPVFFEADGKLKPISPLGKKAISSAIKQGRMPPPPAEPLDDDALLEIKTFFEAK